MGKKKSPKVTALQALKVWMDQREELVELLARTREIAGVTVEGDAAFRKGEWELLQGVQAILAALVAAPAAQQPKPAKPPAKKFRFSEDGADPKPGGTGVKGKRLPPDVEGMFGGKKKTLAGVALAKKMAEGPDPNAGVKSFNYPNGRDLEPDGRKDPAKPQKISTTGLRAQLAESAAARKAEQAAKREAAK